MNPQELWIEAKFLSTTLSRKLNPGDRLILGRNKNCDWVVESDSVSNRHLEILWDGVDLGFRDLKSSNGTRRLSDQSAIQELKLSPRNGLLEIELGRVPVHFQWSNQPQTSEAAAESTAYLESKTQAAVAKDKTRTEKSSSTNAESKTNTKVPVSSKHAQATQSSASMESLAPRHSTPTSASSIEQGTKTKVSINPPSTKQLEEASTWVLALVFSLLLFFLLSSFSVAQFGQISNWSDASFRAGASLDHLVLWLTLDSKLLLLLVAGVTILGAAFYFSKKHLSSFVQKSFFIQRLPSSFFWQSCAVAALVVSLSWPMWAALVQGHSFSAVSHAFQYAMLRRGDVTGQARADAIKSHLPELKGSSLLYVDLLRTQEKRVLEDCEGAGADAPWANKRICLVLLMAVNVETTKLVEPALLQEPAKIAVLLRSLDGLIRVIQTEGKDSPTAALFVNALSTVGLVEEEENLNALFATEEQSAERMLNSFRFLRGQLEQKLSASLSKSKVPKDLWIDVVSPIELGI